MATKLSLTNPLLTPEQWSQPPSRIAKVPAPLETQIRHFACELIEAAGILLSLPQVAMATAQVLLQRFYYVASITQFSVRDTMMACLFLASKLEECPRKVKDIINVFDYVVKRRRNLLITPLEMFSQAFYEMKNGLIIAELQLLKQLGFNVQVQLPYGLLVTYLQCLGLVHHPQIPQLAWNYLNDALRTCVYVCYQPPTIASAAIFLAARQCQCKLPTQPPWWTVFDANLDDMIYISGHILSLYETPLPTNIPLTCEELESYLENVQAPLSNSPSDQV
ncbi:hypothetical protein IWQ62_001086 [Dispira parvispora]|uniref:Cyclin-like domain-containing protein n=1 Tax=Dispira parvispora TaxID=1520584 RepID=A0A9W8AYQ0_9FUNG|nr:hypothetical protein IWQ62_001086 [Dispira parvispora]